MALIYLETDMKSFISTVAMTALATTVFAAPAHAQIMDGWTGDASLSGSTTTGNTETTDVGLGLAVTKTDGIYRNKFDATYDLGSVSGADTKNRLFLGYQLDRDFNDRTYAFGNVNYFKDDFGAFETGYYAGAGLGYKVLVTEPTLWNVEAGLGYRSQETQAIGTFGTPGFLASVEEGEIAARFGSEFDYAFNDAVSFYNDSEILTSSSDTYLWNDAGITAQLAGNLSARFGVRVDHHTDVPVGRENTDTITRGAIVYTIK